MLCHMIYLIRLKIELRQAQTREYELHNGGKISQLTIFHNFQVIYVVKPMYSQNSQINHFKVMKAGTGKTTTLILIFVCEIKS